MILHRKLVFSLALILSTAAAKASSVVYVLGNSGQFGIVDLSSGSFTPVGPGFAVGTSALVQGPSGNLLSLGFDGSLNSINPVTGLLTNIGPTGLGDCSLPTSPCGANSANLIGKVGSHFYATDLANNLYSLNPTTGVATLIGATGIPGVPFAPGTTVPGDPDGSFYIYDESLFDFNGNLYANFDTGIFDPVTFTPTPLISASLYEINTTTGLATTVASTTSNIGTITNVDGTLYAFYLPTSQLLILNATDGRTSYLRDYDSSPGLIDGASAFVAPTASTVPEPASLAMVGSGLAAFAAGIKNRRSHPSKSNEEVS